MTRLPSWRRDAVNALAIVAIAPALASAGPARSGSAATRPAQLAPASVDVDQACGDEVGKPVGVWLAARVKNAKAGHRELVRMPVIQGSSDWVYNAPGSTDANTPASYIGRDADGPCGDNWIDPEFDGPAPPTHGADAFEVIAEGFFTGEVRPHKGPVFRVVHWRPESADEAATAMVARVVLDGPHLDDKVPALHDDRPWLVIVDSMPLFERRGPEKAQALAHQLAAAGFRDASVIDSRSAKQLFCCYDVVLAGRFATRDEALTVANRARKKGFRGVYAKQGW